VERKILGYDHAEVGAYLGESWNLPESLVNPIRYHHQPNLCATPDPVVDAVHVADFLTMSLGLGLGGDGLRYDFETDAMDRLKLTALEIDYLTADFVAAYEAYSKVLEEMDRI
jgi:HD-like signal output (HDOD) protein